MSTKEEKLGYWIERLNNEAYINSGIYGILGHAHDMADAMDIFDTFKKLCQRLEWWPDMAGNVVADYISRHGISYTEIVYILNAYALNPKYVLGRIEGSADSVDHFYRAEAGVDKDYGPEAICFVTCSNNEKELAEMNSWIDRLIVPKGITVDRRVVIGAGSMCMGYNQAMHSSDAKYKVYLHQDVRILNPFFIFDLIDCFDRNPKAGMIGMFGTTSVPDSGVMWHSPRYGAVVHSELNEDHLAETFDEKVLYEGDFKAALIDGFLMATCVDIDWREDIFRGWDLYDASQSMEFLKRGYEIVVPRQEQTWCLHDFGQINWEGYEKGRQVFVETYLSGKKSDIIPGDDRNMVTVKDELQKLEMAGDMDSAYELISTNLHKEIQNLKSDPSYCVLAANAFMMKGECSRAFDLITVGLLNDNRNYELYLTLGEYYIRNNINQALLCFYQALFYCDVDEDKEVIESYIEEVVAQGAQIRQVSVVITSNNQSEYLKQCLKSVVDTVMPGLYEIVVVDNASTDGTWGWLSELEGTVSCCNEEDIGYVKSCNRGIKLADPFNDILLLDADTMLMDNSLFYLMLGLYSRDDIGIVGGITNDFITEQKMYVDTSNMDEAIRLASTVNCPLQDACEDTVCVSDHAMLISRAAIDKVGLLDDGFSPDQYEDKDFCVRVNMSGFKVQLCFNSYIFKFMDRHMLYLKEKELPEKNRKLFAKKWGCNIDYSNNARTGLIEMISAKNDMPIEVLELGCAMGSTLNRIKRLWPSAKVHGIEYDESVARIGGSITDIIQGDVENMEIPYEKKQFDYIICADVLEHLRDPEAAIKRFMPYLKDDGYFLVSIPNVRHYAVIEMLALRGRFDYDDSGILDRTHIKFFTRDTAIEMLEKAGLKILDMRRNYNGHPEDNEFITRLSSCFNVADSEELKVFQYYFLASKR